jgi:hypothetical protein
MTGATAPAQVTISNEFQPQHQSPWDRRGGLERRRGDRRLRKAVVLFDRRAEFRRDASRRRRLHRSIDKAPRNSGSKLVHSILQTPILSDTPSISDSRYRVTVKEGLVATVYSAWEKASPQADGGLYRRFDGEDYRRIGSRLQDVASFDSVDEAEKAYRAEYQRAYNIITGEHPSLVGRADTADGEIISR